MRRTMLLLTVGLLAVTCALFGPTVAGAAPLSQAPATCSTPQPYPPSPSATVQSSTTTPNVGDTIKVSGVRYCADEDVTITIGGKTVGTAHTDGSGSFDPEVVVPGPAGQQQLCGVGASGLATDSDCLTLNTSGAAGQAAGTGNGSGNNGQTAFTGTQVALLLVVALALVGGGVAFSAAGRRKQTARS